MQWCLPVHITYNNDIVCNTFIKVFNIWTLDCFYVEGEALLKLHHAFTHCNETHTDHCGSERFLFFSFHKHFPVQN